MEDIESDVLIVGAGIAGSALACALRNSGYSVVLIDKSDRPLDTARGDHLQSRTCEILDRWGVLGKFFDNGAQRRAGAIWKTPSGEEIMRSTISELDIPHPYFAFMNHEQIATTLLDTALEADDSISVIRPIRNWWLSDDDGEGYTIRVGLPDSGEVNIRTALVVGADGRASRTRSIFGFEAVVHNYARAIAVFFANLKTQNPSNYLNVYLGDSIISVIPRADGYAKIGFPIGASEAKDLRRSDSATNMRLLQTAVPDLEIEELQFGDIYSPAYLRAGMWAKDGVVLLGDACHAMHPARSQGMNISIRNIDTLLTLMTGADNKLDRKSVAKMLTEYQQRAKEMIDPILERNHALGQEMDSDSTEVLAGLEERLRTVQSDERASTAYAMSAAGY